MATKFERVYSQIKAELNELKSVYKYDNDSAAFGHLMLRSILDITDEEAYDSITDGGDDNGLDAVYFDTRGTRPKFYFFQFKFPSSEGGITKAVTQEEILKLCNGFEHFIGRDEVFNELRWNELLQEKRAEFVDFAETDLNYLYIVRYSTCETNENLSLFDSKIRALKSSMGNTIIGEVMLAEGIAGLYEQTRLNTWPDFSLHYKTFLPPFEDDTAKVTPYYVSLYDIYVALRGLKGNIFEGNVRYFDDSSKVNSGIIETLKSGSCARFHLLNNGITIVCSSSSQNTPTSTLNIIRGSIINGAQTVGCILKVVGQYSLEGRSLETFKNSFVFVKVIQIENKRDLVDELVYTLNTQNQMKSSYSISNDPQVKAIQKEINNSTQYFLQIKNNEFNFRKMNDPSFGKLVKDIIDVETAIQAFVAYENIGDFGHLSKGGKGTLFMDPCRQTIVNEITAERLLKSYELFLEIMAITRQYRAYRKDSGKNAIIAELRIDEKDINRFRFINTGNYLILYSLGIYCRKNNVEPTHSIIVDVIKRLSSLFKVNSNTANLTKTKDTFDSAKKLFEK